MGSTHRIVLFLGAGASKSLGYPLNNQIFVRILQHLRDNTLFPRMNTVYPLRGEHTQVNRNGDLPDAMRVLRNELTALFPRILAHGRPPEITELLSLLDHLIFAGSSAVPGFPRERLARLRFLLERAVAVVVTDADRTPHVPQRALVDRLVNWIVAESRKPLPARTLITIITTNYDLAVEGPLTKAMKSAHSAAKIDYGFTWREPYGYEEGEKDEEAIRLRPTEAAVAFYKLHGSINWLHCPLCDHVYLNQSTFIFDLAYSSPKRASNTCSCGHWPLGTLLVAPSMIRDIRDPSLLSIWQAALEAMRRAQRWVVVGYSLPAEDLAIRSLFLRAARGRSQPPTVEIYERGDRPEVRARYRLLLRHVKYNGGGFEAFIRGLPRA